MPLTQGQEYAEHELRMEKTNFDLQAWRLEADGRQKTAARNSAWETRKFLVQLLVGIAAVMGAAVTVTVAVTNYVNRLHDEVASRPIGPQPAYPVYLAPMPAQSPPSPGK